MYEYCQEFFDLIHFLGFRESNRIEDEKYAFQMTLNNDQDSFTFELGCANDGFCVLLGYVNNQYTQGICIKDANTNFRYIADFVDKLLNMFGCSILSSCILTSPSEYVQAAITTKDLSKNMVRVKSSNVWSYTINIRDKKDRQGNVLVTFKGKNGGPEDTYIYYDVPVTLWKKWVVAPSKGSFFWRHIRNAFRYSKLTGDKRGKLPNAIN